jgi:hypothetical protein
VTAQCGKIDAFYAKKLSAIVLLRNDRRFVANGGGVAEGHFVRDTLRFMLMYENGAGQGGGQHRRKTTLGSLTNLRG